MARVRTAYGTGSGPEPLDAAREALDAVVGGLQGRPADLVVAFLGAAYVPAAERISSLLHERLAPARLLGTTAGGVVAGARELERPDCLSVWAAHLPGATLTPLAYPPAMGDGAAGEAGGWRPPPPDAGALVLLADPFTFPADAFLAWLQQARPGLPVSGGLASAARAAGGNRLLLDADVLDRGAVGIALGGDVRLRTLVSQGCRPVGNSYVVTRAERNVVEELAGEPPVDRVRGTFAEADEGDRTLMRAGLHVGIAIDEYAEELGRGDFLVRGVIGAHPTTGALAVGDVVRVGQTVRFHVRDAGSADEDLRELLDAFTGGRAEAGQAAGALLFTCNGRGSQLFGTPDHDAAIVTRALGDAPLAGFFCAGEFGPVAGRSFLHGFTASLLVIDAA